MSKNKNKENISRKINYPVGDFLIRMKNAVIAGNKEITVPATKLIKSVAHVLKNMGYITELNSQDGTLTVSLAIRRKEPVLMNVKLVSKPGLRVYMRVDELESIKGPFTIILSTPLGIMTAKDAIKKRTGGEVIAKIF